MMGASYAFLLIYAVVELFEMVKEGVDIITDSISETYEQYFGSGRPRQPQQPYMPLVIIHLQYFVLILSCLCSGFIFGVLFGIIDLEKYAAEEPGYMIILVLSYEVVVFAPTGFIHGALTGFIFMMLRFCENKKRLERNLSTSYGGAYRGLNDDKKYDDGKPLIKSNTSS